MNRGYEFIGGYAEAYSVYPVALPLPGTLVFLDGL